MKLSKNSKDFSIIKQKQRPFNWIAFLSVLFLLVLWYLVTERARLINPLFIPSPIKVSQSVVNLLSGRLLYDIFATVSRVMLAFLISVMVALPISLLMSEYAPVKKLLMPYIDFIRYIPVPVLIPLSILFFGIGEEAKIVLLFIGTFFQIVLLFDGDLMNVPSDYFDLAYSLNFTTSQRLKMKLLTAMPEMYDDLRISLGLSWSYVIIVELVAADTGIGHMIKEAQRFSHTSDVYVGIIVMGVIGFFSDFLFRKGYVKLFPYKS